MDGSLEDNNYGPGVGWIWIVQKKGTIKGGANQSYYEFLWDDGAFAYGPASGTVTSTGFKITGKAGGNCKIIITGALGGSDNIAGYYATNGASTCKKENLYAAGTFNLPYDPSGCE